MSRGAGISRPTVGVNKDWQSMIHSAYAMMLSFFCSPITLEKAYRKISDFFDTDIESGHNFCKVLIESNEPTHSNLGGIENGVPIHLIIKEELIGYTELF